MIWSCCCPKEEEPAYEPLVEHVIISKGHFSTVFRVTQGARVVILKRFTGMYTPDHEAGILKRLSHVFVPTMHYTLPDAIVMDYVGSHSLIDWLVEPHTPADRAACDHIFQCVTSAVVHIHSRLIAHMDIKCDNIVVDRHGNGHVVDFNIAYVYTPGENEFSILRPRGTEAYMAPEFSLQCGGVSGYRADVWGVGIVLFALMFKRLPFHSCGPECKLFREFVRRSRTQTPVEVFHSMYPTIMTRGDLNAVHHKTLDACLTITPMKRASIPDVARLWRTASV